MALYPCNVGSGGSGSIPIASSNTLGGIKIGKGFDIDNSGVLDSLRDVYSSQDVVVGTWVNGKPLYRKVFANQSTTSASGAWSNFIDVTSLHVDEIVSVYGSIIGANGLRWSLGDGSGDMSLFMLFQASSDGDWIKLRIGNNDWKGSMNLVMFYTKTTDSAS